MDGDEELMRRAQALADAARLDTPPNPWVGCVVVAGGEVVGAGATRPPGGPHAEIVALRDAGARARGATAYVTLEPCAHHGRTPPCVDALVGAGVERVVVALEDPDPRVAGAGIAYLRGRGVTVDVGAGRDEARRSLAPYLVHRRLGRSYCVLKTAMSLDGRIAAPGRRSITGAAARADAHRLRAESQAVAVGSGTALADGPALTVRDVGRLPLRPPLRVLLDARGRVPATGPLFDPDLAPTLVLTTAAAPEPATSAWLAAGAKVVALPAATSRTGVDLGAALETLAGLGVLQAMFEGGSRLGGALLDSGLVDRLVAYVAPTVLGPDALPAYATTGPHELRTVEVAPVGPDVRVILEPGSD